MDNKQEVEVMKIGLSFKVAIGTFFIAGVGVLLISILSYTQIRGYIKENMLSSLQQELNEDVKQIIQDIDNMKKDVKLLVDNEEIGAIFRAIKSGQNYDNVKKKRLASLKESLGKTFQIVLQHHDAYFNIRLIDVEGEELIVSVKDSAGKVIVQRDDALQNKASRPYFQEAIALHSDDVYMSRINLNKEYGTFSIPYIPTIRVALPIYMEGKIFGIIIINANINKLFSIIERSVHSEKTFYIANEEGYYLYNPKREKTFGFDLGTNYKIADDFDLNRDAYFQNGSAFAYKKVFINKERFIWLAMVTSDKFLREQSDDFQERLALYIFLVTLLIAFFSLLLMKYLILPIVDLTKQATDITSGDMSGDIEFEDIKRDDEVGELSHSLQVMIDKIADAKREVEQKVEERTKELHDLNENLEHIVKEKTAENIKQLEAMREQSKMASMGEMIGAIAHQWRQPLNELSIAIQNLKYEYEDGLIDEAFLTNFIEKNKRVIEFMSSTIDDFRNFYRLDKEKELFSVKEALENTLSLQMAQLHNNNIRVVIQGEDFEIHGFRNEFLQVVLNIINNAKDALLEKRVTDAKIVIELQEKRITISDNAGGISDEVLQRVFEPYFTTKEQGKGTGMGLYMSKMIIEGNMQAKLHVHNSDVGATFTIDFNEGREA